MGFLKLIGSKKINKEHTMYKNSFGKVNSIKFYFFGIIFMIGLVFLNLGCQKKQIASDDSRFVYCTEGSPSIFNPQLATDGTSFNASSQPLYNRLVTLELGTFKVKPELAESWKINAAGTEYHFKLRSGVLFHTNHGFAPQKKFSSQDVAFTFNRMLKKDHSYHKVNGGSYEYFKAMGLDKLISEVKIVSETEVVFVLKRPSATFLKNLSMDFASILSAEYAQYLTQKNSKDQMGFKPIGTGPFILTEYRKDSIIRYASFQNYYKGPAKIKDLIYAITPNSLTRFQKMQTLECDLIAEPSPVHWETLSKNPKLQTFKQDGLNVGYIAFNTKLEKFSDSRVRRALSLAMNKESYLNPIFKGEAHSTSYPVPYQFLSLEKRKHIYNPEEAKRLLKEAGQEGLKFKLWTLPVSRPYMPNGKKFGELVQQDLKKIGVEVELMTYDWPTYLSKSRAGEHEAIQMGWTSDNGDAENFLQTLLSCDAVGAGSNLAQWCNKSFDEFLNTAEAKVDDSEREALYKKSLTVFNKDQPWVPVAQSKVFRVLKKGWLGYSLNPLGTENFYPLSKAAL